MVVEWVGVEFEGVVVVVPKLPVESLEFDAFVAVESFVANFVEFLISNCFACNRNRMKNSKGRELVVDIYSYNHILRGVLEHYNGVSDNSDVSYASRAVARSSNTCS